MQQVIVRESFSGGGASVPVYANNFGLSQKIDTLTNATITGGSITGATISGGSVTATAFSGTIGVGQGGTGTTTAPTYGQVLLGNTSGGYDLVATSSLGITSGSSGTEFGQTFERIEREVGRVIVGMNDVVRRTLSCIFAGGHALLEGVPGLGKTLLVKSIARTLGLSFKRIQFTPDLMPSDVTGTQILTEDQAGRKSFVFKPGPIFANIVLADEINRATPKTQSALLEAMEERQVTVINETYALPQPFFVLATQNPVEL